ncbi:hypothetical protein CJ030_MR1G008488 [Morella rubra]|uniref:Uncharacterized protein n=1 Tax=Morella rubra TaxID=262757 RepID=A0A6A1WPR8_9ROSI|nr:hypothetical protein CJ030_MR1G008488 [Morella rubra]
MAKGRITRHGIKCSCCEKVFALSNFEVHAGSKYHRPAASIFLEDGRSLFDCQMQVIRDHIGCLRNRGEDKLQICPEEKWFCCKKCAQILLGLQKILGKPLPAGEDNLTWTLLKPMTLDTHEVEALSENHSKLNVALEVMHECFEPIKESCTQRDLVEDVIFNRGIHGEKMLMELEVERLVLPAIPSVLNTWTTSFGFTKMMDFERLHFLDFTFLGFPDTVMCQKLLRKNPSADSSPSGRQPDLVYRNKDNIDLDVSEVYQAEHNDGSRFMEQEQVMYV